MSMSAELQEARLEISRCARIRGMLPEQEQSTFDLAEYLGWDCENDKRTPEEYLLHAHDAIRSRLAINIHTRIL